MKTYQLYIKTEGRWEWLCTFDAGSHAEAFHRGLHCLGPAHQDKPIRLEQDDETGYRKPCPARNDARVTS
jgi:hypothetical protein